tara:strand:+ start:1835 stop:2149 length:315 start_codon:yes stop_codon:yes gene_type:complete
MATVFVFVTGVIIALIALLGQSSVSQNLDTMDVIRHSAPVILGLNTASLVILLLVVVEIDCTASTAVYSKAMDTCLWTGMYVFSMGQRTQESKRAIGPHDKLKF